MSVVEDIEYAESGEGLDIPTAEVFLPLLEPARYKGARGGRGAGKCLGLGTPVLMHDGSIRVVEHIQIGDLVMGPDSKPRRVLNTTRGESELFLVEQNGGDSYVVNDAHLLSLKKASHSDRYPEYPTVANVTAEAYLASSSRWKAAFRGYRSGALQLPENNLPVPPYVLGAWLGDGDKSRAAIISMDQEIVDEFLAWGSSLDCEVDVRERSRGNKAKLYILTGVKGKGGMRGGVKFCNPAKNALRDLGVLENKHVPFEYATGSLEQRLHFLAGIIDTDGTAGHGYYSVSQKSRRFLKRIKFIASSCGFRTSPLREKWITIRGKPKVYYNLSISGQVERIPCRVKRKKIISTNPNKDWLCGAISVKPIGRGPYAGFELDGDHLFLLGDCTVTHNSHFVAERLIEECATEHHRVACLREYQSSMKESSKQLLEDKIKQLGVDDLFHLTEAEIRGPFDSLIVFKGLQGANVYSLKSLEGFSRAWVEEAQAITANSLDIMTPTFRRTPTMTNDPEMYFTWNPTIDGDPVEKLFLENTSPEIRFDELGYATDSELLKRKLKLPVWDGKSFISVTVNYDDNPWFPADLREDMERDRRRDPDRYLHIWKGEYQRLSQARVFRNWRIEEFTTPDDVQLFFGADWGFGDPSVLVRCYLYGRTLYVDHEAYRVNCQIDSLPAMFDEIEGSRKWPIRADSARPETIAYMQRHGFPHMSASVKGPGSIEDGVEFLKSHDIVVHPRCRHTADELARYSYKVDKKTNLVLPVLEDKNNHVIDALRYALEGERIGPRIIRVSQQALRRSRIPMRRRGRLA